MDRFSKILDEFKLLPKPNLDPTFMNICHMGGDRFEERCSQILKFFFDPNAPHNFRDLFLRSLLELINKADIQYMSNTTFVRTEEATDNLKRIDITIVTDDCIIAIENKILASLYNPLDNYISYIKKHYNQKNKIFIVLSIRRITNSYDQKKLIDSGYINVTYNQLFDSIKHNLGMYITNCNQAYLPFLFDFIRTIENSYYNRNMDEMNNFFYENNEVIKEMVEQYNGFKAAIHKQQSEQIYLIKAEITRRTNADWWVYQDWDLGVHFNRGSNREIGIESNFVADMTNHNPLGKFEIFITVWKKACFPPFEDALNKSFPNCVIDRNPIYNSSRIYLHLPKVEPADNINAIIDKLEEYYNIMKMITA